VAGETVITVVGNLTADPELRYTQNGLAVANFTIASTPRTFDRQSNEWKDGEAMFLRASVWREFGENVANSLKKGSRVIAQGAIKQRSYETKEGEKRTSFELEIYEIGPSLHYATAQVTRNAPANSRTAGGEQTYSSREQAQRAGGQQQNEPWGQPAGSPSAGPPQQQGGGQPEMGGADVWNQPGAGYRGPDETPF
jgi:single-strand DNA-binding protein